MNTQLFIENYEIELNEAVQFCLNKQFEELSNPTTVINDWSKTVSIPFTAHNNKIFGYLYKPNRIIVGTNSPDGYKQMGIYFDPTKKLDFRLVYNTMVLMTGYAKMNTVKRSKGVGTYDITLFGQLGKVFQEMQKITFDTTSDASNYIIDGSVYVNETINKELIYNAWHTVEQRDDILRKKTDNHYVVTDIIGFAPNNSFSEGFDYKTYQLNDSSSLTFAETLGDSFTDDTGISPDSVIPNGMLPREIGEYRSYYQLPYIYFNKLFRIFEAKSEELTGYTFDLDDSWFNETNPYWFNLVYMLRPLSNLKNITYNNIYTGTYNSQHVVYANSSQKYHYSFSSYEPGFSFGVQSEQIPMLINVGTYSHYFELKDTEVVDGQLSVHFKMDVACNLGSEQNVHIRNNGVFVIDVYMTDAATGHPATFTKQLGRICVKWSDSSYVASNTTYTINVGTKTIPSGSSTWTMVDRDFSFTVPADLMNKDVKFSYSLSGWHAEGTFSGSLFVNSNPSSVDLGNITLYGKPNTMRLNVTPLIGKSFSKFILNDLWNNDYNLFTEIIKYCKMFRIGVSVDDFEKKIIFKPYSKYFEDYSIENWTEKIDKSKDYIITPITLENKYILFNYDDNKTNLGSIYKDKYGVNYGDYKLITDYNFNSDSKNLFEKIKTSIVNTDNVLSWSNIYSYHNIIYSFPNEIYVYNKDKDNKQVDIFGALYFVNGYGAFSDEEALHLRPVKISDDTTFQQVNNTYFYTQGAGSTLNISIYPKLDIVRGDNMCLFNIPKENYTYLSNYGNKNTIYKNFWEKYINERYNVQNKKITCYVKLTPNDYNNFRWNKLVQVDDQLCIVNKIYDYDVQSNSTTKVDLITIMDVDGYKTDNFTYDYIKAKPRELTIPYDHYKEATITSTRPWSIHPDDWRDSLVCWPEEGPAGETKIIIGSIDEDYGYTLTFDMYNDEQTEVIGTTSIICSVGGTSAITVSPWYNQIAVGGSSTITMQATDSWSVYKIDRNGNNNRRVLTYPSIGSSGNQTLTISVPSDSSTGVVDVYIKSNTTQDITSYRVNIV